MTDKNELKIIAKKCDLTASEEKILVGLIEQRFGFDSVSFDYAYEWALRIKHKDAFNRADNMTKQVLKYLGWVEQ